MMVPGDIALVQIVSSSQTCADSPAGGTTEVTNLGTHSLMLLPVMMALDTETLREKGTVYSAQSDLFLADQFIAQGPTDAEHARSAQAVFVFSMSGSFQLCYKLLGKPYEQVGSTLLNVIPSHRELLQKVSHNRPLTLPMNVSVLLRFDRACTRQADLVVPANWHMQLKVSIVTGDRPSRQLQLLERRLQNDLRASLCKDHWNPQWCRL